MNQQEKASVLSVAMLVAALGYFVDIYDLLLFSIIRIPSLKALGLSEEAILTDGEAIITYQMLGLLLGGFIWGVLGDKKGRLSVLFGSILLYSVANILNGFVVTVDQYKWIRFVAGIGLAGELGAGITLVSEITAKEKRGIATSMVAGIGLLGAVFAYLLKENFYWRTCYFIGGGMGLILLFLRLSVYESGIFKNLQKEKVKRGNLKLLFASKSRIKRYFLSTFIGLPTWFTIGILVSFSAEFGRAFNIQEPIDPGKAIMFAYLSLSIGDILIGLLSQYLKGRKKALYVFYFLSALFMLLFFTIQWNGSAAKMYWLCAGLGLGTGIWAMFVTISAEQFGTNLRATAATTIPNIVRGLLAIFVIPLFRFLRDIPSLGFIGGAAITALVVMVVGLISVWKISETFNKDLNFLEE